MRSRKMTVAIMACGVGLAGAAFLAGGAAAESTPARAASVDQEGPSRGPLARFIHGQIGRLMVLKADLAMTDEQRDQLRGILKNHRDELVPVIKQVAGKREALREAVLAETPNEESIRGDAAELGKAIGDAAVVFSRVAGQAKTVLTADQLAKISEFRQDRAARLEQFLGGVGAK